MNRLSIKPADSSVLDAELAFTVVKGASSVKGSVTGVRLRGSKTRKDYEGTILADRITGNKKNNSILGLNDADRLYGKKVVTSLMLVPVMITLLVALAAIF